MFNQDWICSFFSQISQPPLSLGPILVQAEIQTSDFLFVLFPRTHTTLSLTDITDTRTFTQPWPVLSCQSPREPVHGHIFNFCLFICSELHHAASNPLSFSYPNLHLRGSRWPRTDWLSFFLFSPRSFPHCCSSPWQRGFSQTLDSGLMCDSLQEVEESRRRFNSVPQIMLQERMYIKRLPEADSYVSTVFIFYYIAHLYPGKYIIIQNYCHARWKMSRNNIWNE